MSVTLRHPRLALSAHRWLAGCEGARRSSTFWSASHCPTRCEQLRRQSSAASREAPRVAVLFQAIDPPLINGVRKPRKPGGYRDSGADIAYILSQQHDITVLTPTAHPSPADTDAWTFPDSAAGILSAVGAGATHLWANTILFAAHPLQTARELPEGIRVVGQPPRLVERYDDKDYVNNLLRAKGGFTLPRAWTVDATRGDLGRFLREEKLPYPLVGKPVRGRGSFGVKVCSTPAEVEAHLADLAPVSPLVMLEEFLAGEEATVTVMPPSPSRGKNAYWALPVVTRFNHEAGIAPYNGVVAVTANSRVVSAAEAVQDEAYGAICRECEAAAELLGVTAPIRVDVRRFREGARFAVFDVNMKPNMTGPGRPGREDQASLTAMAAAGLGWDYPRLLREILGTAETLGELRGRAPL